MTTAIPGCLVWEYGDRDGRDMFGELVYVLILSGNTVRCEDLSGAELGIAGIHSIESP